MIVTGFTFIRNAIKLDYPVVEAIKSILPLCDDVVVAVGDSEDATRDLILAIDPKVRIIDTTWNMDLREGGRVLAIETNKAFDAVSNESDWCVYIQGDECLHEKYLPEIQSQMLQYKDRDDVEGLLLDFEHFYGSYDYLGDSRMWYRHEIRIVKNNKAIRSYKDAQGFRIEGRKLKVKKVNASMYHYGWVRHPKFMMAKAVEASRYWHDDQWIDHRFDPEKDFDYSNIDSVIRFTGSHPEVMQERINNVNWKFSKDPSDKRMNIKKRLLYWIEKRTGYRIGEHKNYRII
jgi:hypothetical protein